MVYVEDEEGSRKVNHLFKADFFGEKALLSDEPRCCTLQHDPAQHLMVTLLSSRR